MLVFLSGMQQCLLTLRVTTLNLKLILISFFVLVQLTIIFV